MFVSILMETAYLNDLRLDAFAEAVGNSLKRIAAEAIAAALAISLVQLALSTVNFFRFGIPGSSSATADLAAAITSQTSTYHSGGEVQTYQSAGGNVPAMLQEGEYVVRRDAVGSIGIENLNRMNRTGQVSGGANITFTGNVLSRDFIEDEAIPLIKSALRKGGDLGIA